jgi:hypothetical protein
VLDRFSKNPQISNFPSSGSRFVPCGRKEGRTDRHDEAKKELGDWLTVHHNITLVDLQLDAQNSFVHEVGGQPRL